MFLRLDERKSPETQKIKGPGVLFARPKRQDVEQRRRVSTGKLRLTGAKANPRSVMVGDTFPSIDHEGISKSSRVVWEDVL